MPEEGLRDEVNGVAIFFGWSMFVLCGVAFVVRFIADRWKQ